MIQVIDDSTPLAMLTVGQCRSLGLIPHQPQKDEKTNPIPSDKNGKTHVYGIAGIAKLFNCSLPTANRIKASGKIDKAITQIGRKIIVDADLALELAGSKNGGRR